MARFTKLCKFGDPAWCLTQHRKRGEIEMDTNDYKADDSGVDAVAGCGLCVLLVSTPI